MKKYKKVHTFAQETYKIYKTIENYIQNYTKKLKYFVTWHIKSKIQLKLSYKLSRNIIQLYKKHKYIHKNI